MSILTLENPHQESDHTILIRFDSGVHAEKSYQASVTICNNPLCICYSVDLKVLGLGDSTGEALPVSLNYRDQQVNAKTPGQAPEFATEMVAQMTDDDWLLLANIYFSEKLIFTENAKLDDIDAHFPRDEIETEKLMVGYAQTLPFAQRLEIQLDGARYWLDDQYCLKTRCGCEHTVISIIPLDGPPTPPEDVATVQLFYRNKDWIVTDAGGHSNTVIKTWVDAVGTSLRKKFQTRHQKLKQLYKQYKQKHGEYQAPHQQAKAKPTVGRNEQCPCGSGKKYKRCCINTASLPQHFSLA